MQCQTIAASADTRPLAATHCVSGTAGEGFFAGSADTYRDIEGHRA